MLNEQDITALVRMTKEMVIDPTYRLGMLTGLQEEDRLEVTQLAARAKMLVDATNEGRATVSSNESLTLLISSTILSIKNVLDRSSQGYSALIDTLVRSHTDKFAAHFSKEPPNHSVENEIFRLKDKTYSHDKDREHFADRLLLPNWCVYSALINITDSLFIDRIRLSNTATETVREIVFSREHRQACIGILSYFSSILQQKLPGVDASVSIRQETDKIVLTIAHPDGSKERVTTLLADYGLVIAGKMSADQLLDNPIQILALNHKLELANMEVRHTRDLLQVERSQASSRFASLESEIEYLRTGLSQQLDRGDSLAAVIVQAFAAGHETSIDRDQLQLLTRLTESAIERDKEKLVDDAMAVKSSDPGLLDKFHAFILSSTVGGPIGNAVYDWLKVVWPVLPK